MSEHARLAPSSGERWVNCPGSVVMQERYPESEESEAAREGTASHWVGAAILEHARGGVRSEYQNFIGQTAPNGIILTEEMVEAADVYASDVLSTCNDIDDIESLFIETKTKILRIHPAHCWGTPDCWFYDADKGILYVWDYKYGHRIVDPYDNWQLILYILGVLGLLFPKNDEPDVIVCMKIVQPRSYHHEGPVREWRFRTENLRGYVNRLENSAENALSDDPRTAAGLWCRDCTGRHVCDTLQRAAMSAVDIMGDVSAYELSPTAMGIELSILDRAVKLASYRLDGLKTQAIETVKSGELVMGWGVEQGKGRQKWDKSSDEVFSLGDLMGTELRKAPEAITPKQAIKAGMDKALIDTYSSTPLTGLKLVPDDGSNAKRVFTQVEG